MKGRKATIILLIIFFIGLCVLLYPAISRYWNSKTQSEAIVDYETMLKAYKPEDFTVMISEAHQYNDELSALQFPLLDYHMVEDGYWKALNITGNGMMGYITIPKIGEELPIFHGTDDAVLANACGHFEGTSLPVGGETTHSVLSAHRGLPNATLFTHLDKMELGDTFTITIFDRTFTYEVDQIRIVKPDDSSLIQTVNGKDYCTLLTCTPYGINTERLLVRGYAVDTSQEKNIYISNEAYRVDTLIVTPIVALPIIVMLLLYVMFAPVKKKKPEEEDL